MDKLSVIKLAEVCGPHCVGLEDGDILFGKILPMIEAGEKVSLDFVGVETVTSSFLNASIGKLFGKLEASIVENRLAWENVDENDDQLIKLVISNAKQHFAKTKNGKKIEEDIIRENHDNQ